jgi:DivIVA domain-containing protein
VRDLLLTLAVALVLGLIVFGAAAFTLGRAPGLEPASPDAAPHDLPRHRPMGPGDLGAVRFDVVLRGYRMDQVDAVLERVGDELGMRDAELLALQEELRLLRGEEERPTGAHAARSDLDSTGVFQLGAGVSLNHAGGAAADEVARDAEAEPDGGAVEDPVEEATGDGPDDGPDGGRPGAQPGLPTDDTAVLGDLLGNDRHPR